MSHLVTFVLGYLIGGITSLVLLGLTVAARRGENEQAAPSHSKSIEESIPAWREHL